MVAVSLLLALAMPVPALAQSMEDRARAAAAVARATTRSSDRLRSNYLTPGLSGQPIATIDGKARFTPTLACQSSASLLEILIQPSATGDIGTVRISQDTDFDGHFDRTQSLAQPVSGICANGIISCRPGTWNDCHFLQWGVDAAKVLRLAEVDMPALSGCYCVNASCGSNLVWGNLDEILKDLGGGMIGALTTADPRIGVAEARISGPVIDYVGAQASACAAAPSVPQTAYRSDPAALAGDAMAASAGSRLFQAVKASPAGSGPTEQSRSCIITREVTLDSAGFDDIVSVAGSELGASDCGTGCRRLRIGGDGDCRDSPPTFAARFELHKPERLLSARIVGMAAEDWVQARVDGAIVGSAGKRPWLTDGLPSGDCAVDGSFSDAGVHDLTAALKAGSMTVAARVRGGKDERWGYVDVEVRVDTRCAAQERLIDLCSGYVADSACHLDGEDVDGVSTFHAGVATGLRPLPQTRILGTDSCSVQLTRDFFLRNRTYRCLVDRGAQAAPDLSRGAYIIDHSTETLLADRTRTVDGTVTRTSRPFSLPDRGTVPACEAVCKTRKPRPQTAAAPAGVIGAQQNAPDGWDSLYHVCDPAPGSAGVCPAGPGEEVVSGCGCLDDFPEAVVMMQSVRLAGADMTCTSLAR